VWEDGLRRLSTLTHRQVPGFSFLVGDALSATILRGEVETKQGSGGTTLLLATGFPVPPRSTVREVAARAAELLA
jgi:hypothetical protein